MKKILLGIALMAGSIFGAQGTITIVGEEIVVTASRVEEKQKESPVSITVITKEEIEASGAKMVVDVLRGVPGLDIAQTGAFGGQASCFLRGAKSEYTLVMIDGMEVNDPIDPGRGFDFAHLSTAGIERIEIVRTSAGPLYGSDAMGGVINIITKRGKKPKASFWVEGGQYNKEKGFEASGASGLFNGAFAFNKQESYGISRAAKGTETDDHSATTVLGNIGFSLPEKIKAGVSIYSNNADFDIDDDSFDDDPNYTSKSKSFSIKGETEISLRPWLKEKIDVSSYKMRRECEDGTDTVEPFDCSSSWYNGKNIKTSWQQNILFEKDPFTYGLISGIEHEIEEGESYYHSEGMRGPWTNEFKKKKESNTGYYLQCQLKRANVTLYGGARIDDHSRFGQKTTYKASSLCVAGKTRIKTSYATGFKAPSLYQLYSSYGTTSLNPDESTSYELGIEQEIGEKVLLGLTCFQNEFKNMIVFDQKYKNIGKLETGGIETMIQIKPTDNLIANANYTYTQAEDRNTGKQLLRRPKHKARFNLNYSFQRANINLSCIYVGERNDKFYDPVTYRSTPITLPSYTLVNLNTSYNLTDKFTLFLKVDNLFGEEYEEVYGYSTPGRSFCGGVRCEF
jgi:vitamin B12 transporter